MKKKIASSVILNLFQDPKENKMLKHPPAGRAGVWHDSSGFTLFELLVSISIIGILTALGVVSFSAAQQKARDSRRVSDMDAIQKAAEQYYGAFGGGVYPESTTLSDWMVGTAEVLQTFPTDPKTKLVYDYQSVSPFTTYCACAALENVTAGNATQGTPGDCKTLVFTPDSPYFCVRNQQ